MTRKSPGAVPSGLYSKIVERVFFSHYKAGAKEVLFEREEIVEAAKGLGMDRPKNVGDLIYSFRYRAPLPASVVAKAPKGLEWVIQPAGMAKYKFVATKTARIVPDAMVPETKVPDSTPGVIEKYSLSDEQALLAKLRYNRLVDIFTCVACYSLQSHLRTHVATLGQVETDEVYIGVDRRGAHYVIPIQAKAHNDKLSVVQIEQDFAMCALKFPSLICRPVAAQFMPGHLIALFEFEKRNDGRVWKTNEKHYRLVPPEEISSEDLRGYAMRPE